MPRTVRNFWLEIAVDGATSKGMGPAAADGGFHLAVLVREQGSVARALEVTGRVLGGGKLALDVTPERRFVELGGTTLPVDKRCRKVADLERALLEDGRTLEEWARAILDSSYGSSALLHGRLVVER